MSTDFRFSQTPREEWANALSHALGAAALLAATPVLAARAELATHPLRGIGLAVFALTMLAMFLVSAVYHALPVGPAKLFWRRCDHAAIYLFIAGSYTPLALLQVQHGGGWGLLLTVWTLATAGAALKLRNRLRHPLLSTLIYTAFGWMALWVAQPLLPQLGAEGRALLLAGGVAYTAGSVFYLLDRRLRFGHFVWHLAVIGGASLHFVALQQALA